MSALEDNRHGDEKEIKTSSIQLTTRTDRALITAIIYNFLRPFGPLLVRQKEKFPAGSPRLSAPSNAKKSCDIHERKVDDVWIYDMTLKKPPPDRNAKIKQKHRIFYFVGGGWQSPPSPSHWKFLVALLKKLPDTTIISLVSYPLAPESPAPITIPTLLILYQTILADAARDDEIVTLAGDSAGGNIVLCLVLEALHQDPNSATPHSIFATCPSTDMCRDNAAIPSIVKHDPILRQPFIQSTADAWTGGWDQHDRRVSPLQANIASLRKAGVKVDGTTAGYDILSPDGILFREKLVENGVEGCWLHWEKQMHCWPLASVYGIFPESREAFKWIVKILKMRGSENDRAVVA